ncbi:MAG: glycosyltransferase [Phycisphaera sp.]|nr:glycosyltransferase [Phycisphaera sp.]
MERPVVLCFLDYYLPGFRAGGPTRTIANLVDTLGDEIDFRIVTRDRDCGDQKPYEGVRIDGWNTVGKAKVFYASPAKLSMRGLREVIRGTPHDAVYLNSFMSPRMTSIPLMLRRLKQVPNRPWIIAPRGELAMSALTQKAAKKRAYLAAAKMSGLYEGLVWQASAPHEAADIRRVMGARAADIVVAPDLPRPARDADFGRVDLSAGADRPLKLVFLGRIAPVKNLDFLLEVLSTVRRDVELTIYGLRDVPEYWSRCESLMSALPANVRASYAGGVAPESVLEAFAGHDLFVFPSRGENFGHVVLESLTAGTPVLVSDQTPWRQEGDGALEVLPLGDKTLWRDAIERWATLDRGEWQSRHENALEFARDYIENRAGTAESRELFFEAIGVPVETVPTAPLRLRPAPSMPSRVAAALQMLPASEAEPELALASAPRSVA